MVSSRIVVEGMNFNGAPKFKFALVNNDGSVSFWRNDGTSVAGSQRTAAVASACPIGCLEPQNEDDV
jgi:hypothetical protein